MQRPSCRTVELSIASIAFVGLLIGSLLMSELCNYDQQTEQRQRESDQREAGAHSIPVLGPGSVESVPSGDEKPPSHHEQGDPNSMLVCDLFRGTTTTDRVIAVATLSYLVVTLWMWQAVQRQADIAGQALTRLERPWVLIQLKWPPRVVEEEKRTGKFSVDNLPDDKCIQVEICYEYVNDGRSPAWILGDNLRLVPVSGWTEFASNDEYPAEEEFSENPGNPLGPGRTMLESQIVLIDGAQRRGLATLEVCLMLYGAVKYRDALWRGTHHTGISWLIERISDGPTHIQGAPPGHDVLNDRWARGQWVCRQGPSRYWRTD